MPKLTKSFIDNEIKPVRSGQVIYRDDELTGFALRVTRRTKTFIVERRVNGKNYRFSIGRYGLISVADARSKARTLLADMANGIAPDNSQSLPSMITLRQAYEKYIEVRPLAKQTRAHYKFLIEKCLVDWLDMPFMSITRDMVEERHRQLSATPGRWGSNGHARANHAMQAIRAILKFASERYSEDGEPLLRNNPVERLTINKQWNKAVVRTGIVPETKLAAWRTAVCEVPNASIRDYFLFALFTGMRRTEAASIRWRDVDFERGVLNVPKEITKTQRGYTVPLSSFALELLQQRHQERKSEYVFYSVKDPSKHIVNFDYVLPEIRKACGYQFQLHDLRRTFLSTGARLDVPFYILKSLVNHTIEKEITDRYININLEAQRRYVELINGEFIAIMGANRSNRSLTQMTDTDEAHSTQLQLPSREDIACEFGGHCGEQS